MLFDDYLRQPNTLYELLIRQSLHDTYPVRLSNGKIKRLYGVEILDCIQKAVECGFTDVEIYDRFKNRGLDLFSLCHHK